MSLLPSGGWLVRSFVRSGIYRWVRHMPLGLVVAGVCVVCVLVLLRGASRRLRRGRR